MSQSPQERGLLLSLAGVQFTHILDFMIMMPLGPVLTAMFHINDAQFGLLVSAYTFSAGASGLLASLFIDRFERKSLLLMLYAGFAAATVACGIVNDYHALMAARIAAGAFGGVLTALVHTVIADTIPFQRRGQAMGVVMASFSVSTVAGVPAGLWLAHWGGWHAPFILLGVLCAGFGVLAWRFMPQLASHLVAKGDRPSVLKGLVNTIKPRAHLIAYAFTLLNIMAGFMVIPFITIFMQTNVGLLPEQVPIMYLIGGAATLVTSRLIGRLSDSHGKRRVYQWLAYTAVLPLFGMTLLPAHSPLWLIMLVSTAFFVFLSGRMIPGMALITQTAEPSLRGAFMSLNGSVQSMGMGLAAFIGGLLISRNAEGLVQGYVWNAAFGAVAAIAAVALSKRLNEQSGPSPMKP